MALYNDVIDLARPYLGPAAEKFVSRQISAHLEVAADQLGTQHLAELAKWCLASGVLVMPEPKAQEFSQKVKSMKG